MILTIVLTVYNKEQYLHRAFSALLSQNEVGAEDYEILVINDGSTDGSLIICDEYKAKFPRVRLVSQSNQGLSMARNNGVDAAKGEYIWFVDADDTISPNSVKLICEAAKYSPDIIPIYAKTEGVDKVRNAIKPEVKTGKEIITSGHWQQCGVFYIYRKEFLKENKLRFMPGVYHEDAEFTPRMLYAAKAVKVVPEILYTVHLDPNSIMQVPRAKRAFDYLTVSVSLSNFVIDRGEEGTDIGKAIDNYTAQDINNAFDVITYNSKDEQKRLNIAYYERRRQLNRVLKAATLSKYRIEGFLFQLFPKRYVQLYNIMKTFG